MFIPSQDLNHGPLQLNASVLPMSYTNPYIQSDLLSTLDIQPSNLVKKCSNLAGIWISG